MNLPPSTEIYVRPSGGQGFHTVDQESLSAPFGFQDKRNRNPNWTDQEIVRFLEMLQEDATIRDLIANRNKKVFIQVAQRMASEGTEKTWDQCRIKLKNLKSQYRYVKERIPDVDQLDLEDDDVVRRLISDCQGRGISPSSIKHLRFLLRFLKKQRRAAETAGVHDFLTPTPGKALAKTGLKRPAPKDGASGSATGSFRDDGEAAVSPPCSPVPGVTLFPDPPTGSRHRSEDSDSFLFDLTGEPGTDPTDAGYRFVEQFNRDMMDQFMEHQRRSQASFARWEQERWRQERETMERWRQEAREHERQLFGMFCTAMAKCNAALMKVLRARTPSEEAEDEEGVPAKLRKVAPRAAVEIRRSRDGRSLVDIESNDGSNDASVEDGPESMDDSVTA